MTIRLRIRTGSTVVCAELFVLRGLREVINGVARIPDLVDTIIAVPNLSLNKSMVNTLGKTTGTYGSAILLITISKIKAFVIPPMHTVIALRLFRNRILCIKASTYRVRKLLVGIVGTTSPYLKFCAVCAVAACYVQAFVSKGLNGPSYEDPILSSRSTAGLYSDSRSIGVRRSCQAFGCIHLSSLKSHDGFLMKNTCHCSNLAPGEVDL